MTCKIYQIFYDDNSRKHIEPDYFIPYDNSHPDKPEEFEFGVMRKLYKNQWIWDNATHLGVFSWKTKLKYEWYKPVDFRDVVDEIVDKHEEYDVLFNNPFPWEAKRHHNVWHHGEAYHSGMYRYTKEILCPWSGLDFDARTDKDVLCFCNYWVGNKKWWDLYMSYMEPFYHVANHTFNKDNHTWGWFPYQAERMFSTILEKHKKDFKIHAFADYDKFG